MQGLSEPHPRCLGLKKYLPGVLLGFLAAGFQVYLIREFSVHFYGNEMTFGFVLGSWLLWGGLGSLFASRCKVRPSLFVPVLWASTALFPFCLCALRLSRFPLHLLPGEITGLSLMLPFALVLGFMINFPLGMLFVLAAAGDNGNVSRVYISESLGAALGGLAVSLVMVPSFSNWQGVAMIGALVSSSALALPGTRKKAILLAPLTMLLIGFWMFDLPSQRIFWKPFELLASRDTPYGKLQVIKTREQVSLYSNGLPIYASGDTAAAEESIHLPFLQNPRAARALLIGGAAGGGLNEALKYPRVKVDYVELDPEIVRLSLLYLPPGEKSGLEDKRVRVFYEDGRSFLRSSPGGYDLIILDLPEPANAQVNRFYTREFFELARTKLAAGGVFSFKVPSSENYLSPERRRFLATLHSTLKFVFPRVEVAPGGTNVFLASGAALTLEPGVLSGAVETMGLVTRYVRRELLFTRLSPMRVSLLRDMLSSAPAEMNSDLAPVSYFYDSILWNAQFRSLESRVLLGLAGFPRFWLLGIPLALALLFLTTIGLKKRTAAFALLPLVFLGFTTIIAELLLLLWFQTLYGSVYGRLALLLASFMAGLFLGAVSGSRRLRARFGRLVLFQAGILGWLAGLFLLLKTPLPEPLFYLLLAGLGFLAGDLFVTANRLFLEKRRDYGLGYGLDLFGSFLGALAASSVLIPLAGLRGLTVMLLALNGLAWLFMGFGTRKAV